MRNNKPVVCIILYRSHSILLSFLHGLKGTLFVAVKTYWIILSLSDGDHRNPFWTSPLSDQPIGSEWTKTKSVSGLPGG